MFVAGNKLKMENKNVGWIIIGIAVLMAIITLIFNNALKKIHELSCDMGSTCTATATIRTQTFLSLSIILVVLVIGLIIMFSKPKEKIIIKKIKEKRKRLNLDKLEIEEKKIVNLLLREGKAMFQSELMNKLGIGKVKTTRLLDKLESKQLIERKRQGLNNIVLLKG